MFIALTPEMVQIWRATKTWDCFILLWSAAVSIFQLPLYFHIKSTTV